MMNHHLRRMKMKTQKPSDNWPFPPPTGPVPWTAKQKKEYERRKLDDAEEAPF